jgi:CrcB protein
MNSFLVVGAGGAIGAMGRYGIGVLIGKYWNSNFPYSTIFVNIIGSLLMGVLIGLLAHYTPAWQGGARLFVAVGLLGGFTTFSAFSLDFIYLLERGQTGLALTYAFSSVVFSIGALFIGLLLVRGLS